MDRVCHFEIPYADRERASKFYGDVFGWQIQHMEQMPYSFAITTPVDETMQPKQVGGINGGMYERGDGVSQSPVVVMEVDSCEQRVADVEAAGGSVVVSVHQVGEMGKYAQVKDSEDNVIGLWQPLHQG
ncbi:MAG: VOC family protein [Planctomycetaceae bacterium]